MLQVIVWFLIRLQNKREKTMIKGNSVGSFGHRVKIIE